MRKLLLLAPVLLLASCHSQQVALRTQPVASELAVATAPTIPLDSSLAATVVAARPATAAPATGAATTPLATTQPLAARRSWRAPRLRSLATQAKAAIAAPAAKRLARHLQRQRPTEGAAESGLGGIGLFFIGVVLAVLAGLGALVSLIPGVSFWGGVGLAAAGLVVLFLLYSLLSGGKGKKAK